MNDIIFSIVALFLGLVFGSFLNVLIPRLHSGEGGILTGRSHCPKCNTTLTPLDLIPVLSYLFTRGKCRHCKTKVSLWYPIVEITVGLTFLLLSFYFRTPFEWIEHAFYFYILLFIFFFDLKHSEIHDGVLIPAIVIAAGLCFLMPDPLSHLIGGLIGFVFFGAQYVLSKGKWIGAGDMRIGAFMGLILGWQLTLVALFISYILGSIIGIFLMLCKEVKGRSAVPLGPFLVIGTFITFFYGEVILRWYLSLHF
jgi:prepilin signal peptidase PulO-like enzyme (type II secretory pathway)